MSLFKAVRDAVQKPALYVNFRDDHVLPEVHETNTQAINRIRELADQAPNYEYVTVTVFPPKGMDIKAFKGILEAQLKAIP